MAFRRYIPLTFAFAALATLHTWPLATDPTHLTRLDNDDTALTTWIVAWVSHQLLQDPLHLFDAPIFFPESDALAFSEHMIVPALIGSPLSWSGASPVLVYNLLVWAALGLSGFTMAAVMRGWTGSTTAGVLSGCLFAFNAHLLTRYPHLQALHVQFLPLVLYAFDRVLRDSRPRYAVLLAGIFVLQALCSNYTMVMLMTALVASLVVRPEPWRAGSTRLWVILVLTAVAVMIAMLPFLLPYYRVRSAHGLVRTLDEVRLYSAGWLDYLATAGRLHYRWWAYQLADGRTALFPGFVGAALTLAAVCTGVAWRDQRARMATAFGVLGFALSFGPALPGYEFLYDRVWILQGFRGAARWGFLFLVAVSILAGFAVARFEARWHQRTWWPAVAVALIGLVTLEALRAPIPMVRYAGVPLVHGRLDAPSVNAIVVLPVYGGHRFNRNAPYLLDQTRHWQPMVNGYSGSAPESFYRRAELLRTFPSEAALDDLSSIGVTHVVVQRVLFDREFGRDASLALRDHPRLDWLADEEGVAIYRMK